MLSGCLVPNFLRFELRAVGFNYPISVEVSDSMDQFGFVGRGDITICWIPLPTGVRFTQIPKKQITFYPRGNAAPAGTFHLENSRGSVKVIVAVSGRVRWEKLG